MFTALLALCAAGCYPTVSEQDTSTVRGWILDAGKPVQNAQIGTAQTTLGDCVIRPVSAGNTLSAATLAPPRNPDPGGRLKSVDATTDSAGYFEIPGTTSPGLVWVTKEKIHGVKLCILVDQTQLYRGSVHYMVGLDRCGLVEVSCDLSSADLCQGGPRMLGNHGDC